MLKGFRVGSFACRTKSVNARHKRVAIAVMSARHAAQLITGAPGSESNRDFNALRVPNGYVPGLGRGASGFTTRSDIGPARVTVDMPTAGEGQVAAAIASSVLSCSIFCHPPPPLPLPYLRPAPGRNGLHAVAQAPGAPPKKADKAGDDGGDAVPDENKFDEFMGADGALLAGTTGEYDKDDREADEVWAQIDEFMDNRRRVGSPPFLDLRASLSAFLSQFAAALSLPPIAYVDLPLVVCAVQHDQEPVLCCTDAMHVP